MTLNAARDTSPAKPMTVAQAVAEKPTGETKRVCDEGRMEGLNPTTPQKKCLLFSANEVRVSNMNDYFEDRLRSFDENRLAELAITPSPHKRCEGQPGSPSRVTRHICGGAWEIWFTCYWRIIARTFELWSRNIDSNNESCPCMQQEDSNMLEECPRLCAAITCSRITFEVGDEKTPVAKCVSVSEGWSHRSQNEFDWTGNALDNSEIEITVRVFAARCNPLTTDAGVQRVE